MKLCDVDVSTNISLRFIGLLFFSSANIHNCFSNFLIYFKENSCKNIFNNKIYLQNKSYLIDNKQYNLKNKFKFLFFFIYVANSKGIKKAPISQGFTIFVVW